jgi:outer membrane lipoprotein SlyB
MKNTVVVITAVMFVITGLILMPAPAEAQKKGQSAKIQHGVVVKAERVDLTDSKTTQGALVGGTIGLVASSGKSGKTKRRNTALSALAGGAIGSARSTTQMGMMYTVEIAGGAVKVVTDQTEIHMGDCVVVEETSQGTNLRRVNAEVCNPAAAEVVAELQDEFVEEAEECATARKELAAAKTDAEFDRALMKVDILCNG